MNVWNTVAPRIHAAYDLFGNGRTVIKGGWGRFDHLREVIHGADADQPQQRPDDELDLARSQRQPRLRERAK